MSESLKIVGVHPVDADEPVHLIEIEYTGSGEIDFDAFTQEIEGMPKKNWQCAYDEQELPSTGGAVFFFHYLDLEGRFVLKLGNWTYRGRRQSLPICHILNTMLPNSKS